jgi:hypothetical protein
MPLAYSVATCGGNPIGSSYELFITVEQRMWAPSQAPGENATKGMNPSEWPKEDIFEGNSSGTL